MGVNERSLQVIDLEVILENCYCLHIKNRSDLYPVFSISYSSRHRNEFPWSQANPEKRLGVKKDPEKVMDHVSSYMYRLLIAYIIFA